MKKPKVYIDKEGLVTIIFGPAFTRQECQVDIVHDRKVAITKKTNMFGYTPTRFVYHCANAYGDSGYSSNVNAIDMCDATQFTLIRRRKR